MMPTLVRAVEGSAFNLLNPRVDSSHERRPIKVYFVDGRPILEESSAVAAAEMCSRLRGQPVQIDVVCVDGANRQLHSTVNASDRPYGLARERATAKIATEIDPLADTIFARSNGMVEVHGPHPVDPINLNASAEIVLTVQSLDVGRPLPGQVARWVQRIARRLSKAARRISRIEDGRNFGQVRKLVAAAETPDFKSDVA